MGLILSYMGLILSYMGLILTYMGLILTYMVQSDPICLNLVQFWLIKTNRPKCPLSTMMMMKLKNLMRPAPWGPGRIKIKLLLTSMDATLN